MELSIRWRWIALLAALALVSCESHDDQMDDDDATEGDDDDDVTDDDDATDDDDDDVTDDDDDVTDDDDDDITDDDDDDDDVTDDDDDATDDDDDVTDDDDDDDATDDDDDVTADDDDATDDDDDDDSSPADADGDGWSAPDDCDDNDPAVNPGATEICGNVTDDNCDGLFDLQGDGDGDGYDGCLECDDTNGAVYPGAYEACDGVDNNCDGVVDEGVDGDGDGYTPCDGDCDDTEADANPGMVEDACAIPADGIDNDCDGETDEGCNSLVIQSPAYVYDTLDFTLLTGDAFLDLLLNTMLAPSLPPQGYDLILIFDPTSGPFPPTFSARTGGGDWSQGTFQWDPTFGVPMEFQANMNGVVFDTAGQVVTTVFALPGLGSLTLYNYYSEGEFDQVQTIIADGFLYGELTEADAALLPNPLDPTESVADVISANRALDSDTDGDGQLDAWSIEADYTAYLF